LHQISTRDLEEHEDEEVANIVEDEEEDGSQKEKDIVAVMEMVETGVGELLKKAASDVAISDLKIEELSARLMMGLGEKGVVIKMDR
jgi:hypothetical protein